MHFGQVSIQQPIVRIYSIALLLCLTVLFSCKEENSNEYIGFKFPEQGAQVKQGEDIKITLDVPEGLSVKQATYLIDGKTVIKLEYMKPFS